MSKQFSAAYERNHEPILVCLRTFFANTNRVLEVGSGTGQHAVYFGAGLPHLTWQTSDLPQNHASILAWQQQAQLPNVLPPITLDMCAPDWPSAPFDAVFTANTCHIMAWPQVEQLFAGAGQLLPSGGLLCVYGPFNYAGQFTSAGNASFDAKLRQQSVQMGIRDFEALDELAVAAGFALQVDQAMPANNRMLLWRGLD